MRWSPIGGITLLAGALLASGMAPANAKTKAPPNMTGEWRLDAGKSESPSPPERSQPPRSPGMGRGGGGYGGGGYGGGRGGSVGHMGGGHRGGGYGGGSGAGGERSAGAGAGTRRDHGGSPAFTALLPPLLMIEVAPEIVRLADSSGTELADIELASSSPSAAASPFGVKRWSGKWKGAVLHATSDGAEGSRVTETFSLKRKGRTLEVETKVEPAGDRPSYGFKRVYEKAAG